MDELNNLEFDESLFDAYFEDMEIPKEEKERRADFSKKFNKAILLIFATIAVMKSYNYLRRKYIVDRVSREYRDILSQYMDIDEYLNGYIDDFAEQTTDTTFKNIDDDFFLSNDRAFLISVNEANTGFNYKDYVNAIESGKTHKKWITEKDKRVRRTHRELDDKTIPILDTFKVGKTKMRYPKDMMYANANLEEVAGCRCSIKYL